LTTSGQPDYINIISVVIKYLAMVSDGKFIPAKGGQGHWFFHHIDYLHQNQDFLLTQ
jgi:hypothetical protein